MKNDTVQGRHVMRCAAFILLVGVAGAFGFAAAAAQVELPAGAAPAGVTPPAAVRGAAGEQRSAAPAGGAAQRNPTVSPAVPAEASPNGPPKTYDPSRNCVDLTDANVELRSGRRPVGGPIIYDHLFLPTVPGKRIALWTRRDLVQ